MTEYLVKVDFWLRVGACPRGWPTAGPVESLTVEAATDTEPIEIAKTAAKSTIDSHADPEAIDTDEWRHGVIAYIGTFASGTRKAVSEDVIFDTHRVDASP